MAVEVITTVLTPAASYDLTDLATVKDELQIPTGDTSSDAFLGRAITQASVAIANYCNRVFPAEAVQDLCFIQQDPYPYQVPGGIYSLQLSRWPLVNSAVVAFTGNTHGSTLVDGLSSTAGLSAGLLVFGPGIPAGAAIASVNAGARSITLSQAATATASGAPFTTGVSVVQTIAAGVTQSLVYGTDFTIDSGKGWLIRLNPFTGTSTKWEAEPVTVQYQGGYATIPADVIDAALRLVTLRYKARGRDPMLKSLEQPGLGTEIYWVGGPPTSGSLPLEIAGMLDNYRVPVAV